MSGLVIGFDLCDTYTQIAMWNEETGEVSSVDLVAGGEQEEIPTTICKCRRKDEWAIGEAACEMALLGAGIVVDKLLRLVKKNGMATLEGRTYQAQELLEIYIREVLNLVTDHFEKPIARLIFTLKELDVLLMDQIMKSVEAIGIEKDRVQIISHTESYLYYLLRQSPDNFANLSCLFDLSKEGLSYFEAKVLRGMSPQIMQAASAELEEGFSLDILETDQGRKLADNIFQACVERQLSKKIISSVYLTGRGMKNIQEWGNKSLARICNRRRVYLESQLFAKGAVWMGQDMEETQAGRPSVYPYRFICEGRITSSVSMDMQVAGIPKSLILVEAGNRWYTSKASVEFILDNQDSVDLSILEVGTKKAVTKKIVLGEMPNRPNKTTRLRMEVQFTSENELRVTITDLGFGAIFPSENTVIVREIAL